MGLADDIADEIGDDTPDYIPRTEFDGTAGYIQTGPQTDGFDPTDIDGILALFGYDPEKVGIVGPAKISKWQQRARIRGTGVYETTWLTAYKFTLVAKGFSIDLPALYNEVRKTKVRPLKRNDGASTAVIVWADVQTGKVDHLGGLTELMERLESKRAAVKEWLRRQRFDRIVIADAGDIIEGFSNFPAQHRTNCLSLMDQVDVAATELWKTIKLCAAFAPVDVLSIPSNHCAWRREGKNAGRPTDDWGLHINKRLESLNTEVGLPVSFHRADEWQETLQFEVRDGVRLGLVHGHQVNNPDQIKAWWAKMGHAGVLSCDVLVSGHFHFASLRPSGRDPITGRARWHIQAPTLDNGSAWVRNKMGEDGDPALAVFQINDDGFDVASFALL
ncbi:MAG TPA: hypothetical protein PLE49_18545 [Mycobacterium sp.]|nr:hypothetical protein [Mycobacterium sp.]